MNTQNPQAPPPSNIATVKKLLEDNREAMSQSLPKAISPDRLMRVVLTALTINPFLQNCTQQSLIASLLRCALYGLEPDGVEAALVPYKNKGVLEAQLQPMYQGLIKLSRNSGKITIFYAEIVYENDEFRYSRGINPDLVHLPVIKGEQGEPIGAYSAFKFTNGDFDFEYMKAADIIKIGEKSLAKIQNKDAKKYSPWTTYPMEMWKKTVLKRLSKRAPKSFELTEAINYDNQISGEKYNAGRANSALFQSLNFDPKLTETAIPEIIEPQATSESDNGDNAGS